MDPPPFWLKAHVLATLYGAPVPDLPRARFWPHSGAAEVDDRHRIG
jgi:hypothetical protein